MFEFNNRACKSPLKLFKLKKLIMVKLRMQKCPIRTSNVSGDWVGGLGAEIVKFDCMSS